MMKIPSVTEDNTGYVTTITMYGNNDKGMRMQHGCIVVGVIAGITSFCLATIICICLFCICKRCNMTSDRNEASFIPDDNQPTEDDINEIEPDFPSDHEFYPDSIAWVDTRIVSHSAHHLNGGIKYPHYDNKCFINNETPAHEITNSFSINNVTESRRHHIKSQKTSKKREKLLQKRAAEMSLTGSTQSLSVFNRRASNRRKLKRQSCTL